MAEQSYVVTGAYVTVKTMTPEGERVVGRYAGSPVPPDASPEWIEHHLAKELIAAVPGPPPPPSTGAVAEQGAPDLTADQEPAAAQPRAGGRRTAAKEG